jgi:hypothetical protein
VFKFHEGTEVRGINSHLVRTVTGFLTDAGFKDVRAAVQDTTLKPTAENWQQANDNLMIVVGHPTAGPASGSFAPSIETVDASGHPNYLAWSQHDRFTLREAAFLWNDEDPKMPAHTSSSASTLSLFRKSIAAEKLECDLPIHLLVLRQTAALGGTMDPNSIPETVLVRREDLKAFAQQKGVRPRFLFSEDG